MKKSKQQPPDPYIGIKLVQDYIITAYKGKGKIGIVYRTERKNPPDILACKIIPKNKLNKGWEREIEKVVQLRNIDHVVQYNSHGESTDRNQKVFAYVLYDFIPGINLKEYLSNPPLPLDMAFVENIAKAILDVLHACKAVKILHGDLHEGNVLIREPDRRIPGSPRTIWISDFGYGGSHNGFQPKDDYRQFFSIVSNLLHHLDPASLNPRDRIMHQKLNEFLQKKIMEFDATQGGHVGNSEILLKEFSKIGREAEREAAAATRGEDLKEPGDYLSGEALGYRVEEWKNLFVSEFLAVQDILSRNITVLTGARGCGKTMSFRRLTVFMDMLIGSTSGVPGADQFIGFYVNCRDLVEAFPWLPHNLTTGMQQQIIHYFHLLWFNEICKTMAISKSNENEGFDWLNMFMVNIFGKRYQALPSGADVISHVRAFIETEKEQCRLTNLGKHAGFDSWPLARFDFLDNIQVEVEANVPWVGKRPFYLFLDDYTDPIVRRDVQQVLNAVVFKRRSSLFFKISTEASNSFERKALNDKPFELNHDFELVDLATESLHQDKTEKFKLLDNIFKPRIDRHSAFKGKKKGLLDILGKMEYDNNALAWKMRKVEDKERILYSGADVFVGMWSSDIRIMIQMFVDMLRDTNGELEKNNFVIPIKIQDKVYRSQGGEFLGFAESAGNPMALGRKSYTKKPHIRYGTHLKDIIEAFIKISRYELTKGNIVKNGDRENPKQAFRLEIIDKFELTENVLNYYEGLIRWHLFLQDWRGKSVRGMITPRLYMNRVLIPFANLTFSIHDNIQLRNDEFIALLEKPKEFMSYWVGKRNEKIARDEGPTLFDISPGGGGK